MAGKANLFGGIMKKEKKIFKKIKNYIFAILIVIWGLNSICEILFVKVNGSREFILNTPSVIKVVGVIAIVAKVLLIDTFNKSSLIIRRLVSKIFGNKHSIEVNIVYGATQNKPVDMMLTKPDVRLYEALTNIGVKKLKSRYTDNESATISGEMNKNTYDFVLKNHDISENNTHTTLEMNNVKANYNDLNDRLNAFNKLKLKLIDEYGGIKKTPHTKNSGNYKVTLKFERSTPFYRFTINELEKKKDDMSYCIEINDNQTHIILKKHEMIIMAEDWSELSKVLSKYFLELSEA